MIILMCIYLSLTIVDKITVYLINHIANITIFYIYLHFQIVDRIWCSVYNCKSS